MLVMQLETTAAKIERNRAFGDIDKAELVDLLRRASRRIRELESDLGTVVTGWAEGVDGFRICGND